jgi:hypothetical protein
MKRELARLMTLGGLLAMGCLTPVAQENKPLPNGAKVPSDGTFKVLTSKSIFGKVVKGAPYSATATTETVQTLGDGNQIIRRNESRLYRDSEGRTRMEQTLGTIGKWAANGEAQQLTTINDPVAGLSFSLDSRTRTAYKKWAGVNVGDPGDLAERTRLKQAAQQKAARQEIEVPNQASRRPLPGGAKPLPEPWQLQEGPTNDERRKTEVIGKQMIEGVEVVGTRSTLTIPAGEIGNTLPIEVVDETWYSPELQMMLMTKRRDPRTGETTYRLTNLTRSEPDRALFEVPGDYTVKENSIPPKPRPTKEE